MNSTAELQLGELSQNKEEARLALIAKLRLIDRSREVEYKQLVELAAQICGTPMGAITIVGRDRTWMQAAIGTPGTSEIPRDLSFCKHVIEHDELFVVEDTTEDDRFRTHALVTGEPHIRFYAGMPLGGTQGAHLGTLCVADTVPRRLSTSQQSALQVLALQVNTRLEKRLQEEQLREALEQKEALIAELRSREDLFRTFMDSSPCLAFMKDGHGRFVYYNKTMSDEFEIGPNEWMGRSVHNLFPEEMADKYRETDLDAMATKTVVEHLEKTVNSSGSVKHWKSYKFPWVNQLGEEMLGGISVDVTTAILQQEELERLVTKDSLTGLLNRRALDAALELEIQKVRRSDSTFSVIMLDIDNFKRRNDEHGHPAGDQVLIILGRVMQSELRVIDLAARYGGEEFVALLPGTNQDGAIQVAERLRMAMTREVWPGGPLTASFGTASSDTTVGARQLMARADEALYKAKRGGKDQVVSWVVPNSKEVFGCDSNKFPTEASRNTRNLDRRTARP